MTSNAQAKTSGPAQLSSHLESASEQLREGGAAALEWVTKYLERVESLPVLSQVKPGEVLASLPQHPPSASDVSFGSVGKDCVTPAAHKISVRHMGVIVC